MKNLSIYLIILFYFFCITESNSCDCILRNPEQYYCYSDFALKIKVKLVERENGNEIRYGVLILKDFKENQDLNVSNYQKTDDENNTIISDNFEFYNQRSKTNKIELTDNKTLSGLNEESIRNKTGSKDIHKSEEKYVYENNNNFMQIYTFNDISACERHFQLGQIYFVTGWYNDGKAWTSLCYYGKQSSEMDSNEKIFFSSGHRKIICKNNDEEKLVDYGVHFWDHWHHHNKPVHNEHHDQHHIKPEHKPSHTKPGSHKPGNHMPESHEHTKPDDVEHDDWGVEQETPHLKPNYSKPEVAKHEHNKPDDVEDDDWGLKPEHHNHEPEPHKPGHSGHDENGPQNETHEYHDQKTSVKPITNKLTTINSGANRTTTQRMRTSMIPITHETTTKMTRISIIPLTIRSTTQRVRSSKSPLTFRTTTKKVKISRTPRSERITNQKIRKSRSPTTSKSQTTSKATTQASTSSKKVLCIDTATDSNGATTKWRMKQRLKSSELEKF
jgi:hypothetical protein